MPAMNITGIFKSFFRPKADVLARYERLREAISGTMSKFYMVRDRETGEILGLKILDNEQTAALDKRLGNVKRPSEGEIAITFDHPNIVKTLQHGVTVNDEQFLLMEYLDGPGLNSLIVGRSGDFERQRLALIRQAAEALSAVHEAGYIHRDICPRNYVAINNASLLKLIDFGLSLPDTPEFRKPGNRSGTPAYMAPEVVRRKGSDLRVDVFSFGVTAYEMCTMRMPWRSGTDGKAALMHDSVAPTPIYSYRPDLDPRLATAIMNCLAVDPGERPQTMREFLRSIVQVRSESTAS